jgi:hypothetical protein
VKLNKIRLIFFITIFWVATVVVRLKYNGLILGFDYGLYQIDGAHYTFRTLRFLGYSEWDAANKVSDWYHAHAFKHSAINPQGLIPRYNPVWNLVSPRILYPLLSLPFVWAFGIVGMLIIPALSLLILFMSILAIAIHYRSEKLGIIIILIIGSSPTILRWMILNCTDSLLTALFSLFALYICKKNFVNLSSTAIAIFVILTSFTRVSFPIWFGIAIVYFLKKEKKISMKFFVYSFFCAIPIFLAKPSNALLPSSGDASIIHKIMIVPANAIKVLIYEVGELIVLDKLLFLFIAFTFYVAFNDLKKFESLLFIGVLLGTISISVANGTIGVNLRYELPFIPFAALLLISNKSVIGNWLSR